MKTIVLSDTHWMFPQLVIPKCDMLLHCGDLEIKDFGEAKKFSNWWNEIDCPLKIIVPGNHDRLMEKMDVSDWFIDTMILINQQVTLPNGLCIAGTPYTPTFMNWAFMEDDIHLGTRMSCITNDADIIMSHGPMHGIHDEVDPKYNSNETHVGSKTLREIVNSLNQDKHRYMFHGHIHQNAGDKTHTKFNNVDIYNVSVADEDYKLTKKPLILEI